ncbi:hypothetical protein CAE01nite_15840 [Cellulomonas aerilata]|uniref:Uncharacterized protein n=1 Tax=Cellulomonas aerilata TaxID=515326 RepID=A0A512DBK0_9CELL|nr:hypothetical protein CAE01nite_15840 [Cellulomonas aerilata]
MGAGQLLGVDDASRQPVTRERATAVPPPVTVPTTSRPRPPVEHPSRSDRRQPPLTCSGARTPLTSAGTLDVVWTARPPFGPDGP